MPPTTLEDALMLSPNSPSTATASAAVARRKSTSSLSRNLSQNKQISNNLVLQQLRVALKKLPEAKLSSLKSIEAVKRRHSADDHNDGVAVSVPNNLPPNVAKKAKIQPRRPLSAHKNGGQGKITEYLPEMKQFIAMRKEKLDRVLNLNKVQLPLPASNPEEVISDISSTGNKDPSANESGVETGSNDTASVASSGSRHSLSSGIGSTFRGEDRDLFEVPRTIRFPPAAPTKCYSEVVICKWELCGNEFDTMGKLLDHLKVRNIYFLKVVAEIEICFS